LPSAQIDYWNGLYFTGVSPPHVVNSSEAALRYVQKTKGAIAYVDACALLEKTGITKQQMPLIPSWRILKFSLGLIH